MLGPAIEWYMSERAMCIQQGYSGIAVEPWHLLEPNLLSSWFTHGRVEPTIENVDFGIFYDFGSICECAPTETS